MKCILFDLGGVLIKLWGETPLFDMCPQYKSRDELESAWISSKAVNDHECGRIDFTAFCPAVVNEMNMKTTPEIFAREFRKFIGNVFNGVDDLILKLKEKYTVACLSNTNVEHIRILRGRSNLLDLFHHTFLSYEMGLMKPDPEAFTYVSDTLKLEPSEIFFIDDNKTNVEAAQKIGFNVFHSDNFADIKNKVLTI